jgi:hypothetical protein
MRVFISSTFLDLIDHRHSVADAVERLGLRLSRMETFGARPEDPAQACLAEIDSSELFVGIYAHRYGYVPPDAATSITEAEFDYAFANRRPTFCFFVDEGYPWPEKAREGEPGRSRLSAFKARVQQLIVRDSFTSPDVLASRVTSSIGRYLLADPRRHGAPGTAQFARLTLADIATMTFVDMMRLASVAGSDLAKGANELRYTEFVDMADLHLGELRTQVTRLGADSDADTVAKCDAVERGLAWAMVRLRRGPSLDRPWPEFVGVLRGLAENVHILADSVSQDYYSARTEEVASIVRSAIQHVSAATLAHSPDSFVRHRFSAQSVVVEQMRSTGRFALATVRDDIDRRLAIPYFSLDRALLRKAAGQ